MVQVSTPCIPYHTYHDEVFICYCGNISRRTFRFYALLCARRPFDISYLLKGDVPP